MEKIFRFLLTDIRCNFLLETNLQRKSGINISTLPLWSNDFATVLQRFRNGTETVHLQRNGSLQRIETGCETFQEKRFENYFATVIFVSGKLSGNAYGMQW
jgi:hypothetical protein